MPAPKGLRGEHNSSVVSMCTGVYPGTPLLTLKVHWLAPCGKYYLPGNRMKKTKGPFF